MNLNIREIKTWWDVENAITQNKQITVAWLIKHVEKYEKALRFYADNQHVKRNIRQGKEFIEVENGETAKKALEDIQ